MGYRWPSDTAFTRQVLTVEDKDCSLCGRRLHVCDHRLHHIFTFGGPVEVDQETGGYQESHSFCWKGPCPFCIPWICTNSSGTNQLHLDGELWNPGAFSGEPFNQTSSNVTHIEFNAWSICFCPTARKASDGSMNARAALRISLSSILSTKSRARRSPLLAVLNANSM